MKGYLPNLGQTKTSTSPQIRVIEARNHLCIITHFYGIWSSPNLNFIEFLKKIYRVSFCSSAWVKFNFFYFLFINNSSAIESFAQNIIRSIENYDPHSSPITKTINFNQVKISAKKEKILIPVTSPNNPWKIHFLFKNLCRITIDFDCISKGHCYFA